MMQHETNRLEAEMLAALNPQELKSEDPQIQKFMEFVGEELTPAQEDFARRLWEKQNPPQIVKTVVPKEEIFFMRYDPHGQFGGGVYCDCGMRKIHKRGKVLAAWADKHFEKFGHYWKRS